MGIVDATTADPVAARYMESGDLSSGLYEGSEDSSFYESADERSNFDDFEDL